MVPKALRLTWLPRSDGKLFSKPLQQMVQEGLVADVPFVTGDCDDEGTLFGLSTTNITSVSRHPSIHPFSCVTYRTGAQALAYAKANYAPKISPTEAANLAKLYPSDPTVGSPFGTGTANQLTPQFKRIAAISGDLVRLVISYAFRMSLIYISYRSSKHLDASS